MFQRFRGVYRYFFFLKKRLNSRDSSVAQSILSRENNNDEGSAVDVSKSARSRCPPGQKGNFIAAPACLIRRPLDQRAPVTATSRRRIHLFRCSPLFSSSFFQPRPIVVLQQGFEGALSTIEQQSAPLLRAEYSLSNVPYLINDYRFCRQRLYLSTVPVSTARFVGHVNLCVEFKIAERLTLFFTKRRCLITVPIAWVAKSRFHHLIRLTIESYVLSSVLVFQKCAFNYSTQIDEALFLSRNSLSERFIPVLFNYFAYLFGHFGCGLTTGLFFFS